MRKAEIAVGLVLMSCVSGMGCSQDQDSPAASRVEQGGNTRADSTLASGTLEARIQHGRDVYQRGEYDSARAILESALEEARRSSDSAAEARVLTALGLTAYRRGDYGQARQLQGQALNLKKAIDLTDELWKSYNALGLIAWNEARLSEALTLYGQAVEHAPAEDDPGSLAAILNNQGLIHTDLGDFAAARSSFERSRNVSAASGETRLEGIGLNNLGMLSIWVGNPVEAVSYLDKAMQLYRLVDFVPGELNALGQLGTAYTALGEIGKAIAILDSALQLSRQRGMRQEEASNLEALAEAYRTAGDFRRALHFYEQAERINEDVGLVDEAGSDQRSRAEIYAELGEFEGARRFALQAVETHRSVEARWEELADLVLLADVVHQLGYHDASAEYLESARSLTRAFDARTARVDVALTDARIADRENDHHRVLHTLTAAREDLSQGTYDTEWEAEYLRGRAWLGMGVSDSAVAAGRRAVEAVERVRAGFASGVLRTAYASSRLDAYSVLVRALLLDGDVGGALEASDAARGRALLDHLTAASLADDGARAAALTLGEGEEILRRITELSARMREFDEWSAAERDSSVLADLRVRLAQARTDFEALRVRAIEQDRVGVALLGGGFATAQEIQDALRPGEILVEYLVTPQGLVSFVVSGDHFRSFEHPISGQNLARRVRIARSLIADREAAPQSLRAVLEDLHKVLVAPTSDDLAAASRMIVVPHGVLNYLPFAALLDETTGRYLAEDYALQLVPSAGVLSVVRARSVPRDYARLGVAGGTAFVPFHRSLPATRDEGRAFRRTVPNARLVEGNNATEPRFRETLAEPRLVHVASHGVMNARNPMFSRIELAPGRGESSSDDGRFEVHELLALSVSSPLVFLSGCDTGLGVAGSTEFVRGEDYATLAQAFLYAGARNVIATLWAVEDQGAADFAGQFYETMAASDPVEALAVAQRASLEDERYSAPYYWAAYQLAGDGLMPETQN
jgi:CHAT domain-containing protein/Tfp pilus assembly protein PilF